ncbi:MAG: hypothetical protein IKA39_05820 [Clostridia bacterium]|nr:hypothetical protein [Clostridia bacterium]
MKTKLNLSIKTVMHLSCVVLSLVGLLFIFISLGNVDYNYSKIGLIILLGVMAFLCYVANGYLTYKKQTEGVLATVLGFVSLALSMAVLGIIVWERAVLASSLFTFDSQNTAGWNAFSISLVSVATFLLCSIATTISGFIKD